MRPGSRPAGRGEARSGGGAPASAASTAGRGAGCCARSGERRGGEERRTRWGADHLKKKKNKRWGCWGAQLSVATYSARTPADEKEFGTATLLACRRSCSRISTMLSE